MRRALYALTCSLCLAIPMSRSAFSGDSVPFQQLHAAWFTAFDKGDGAAMDQIETDNLALGMPDGSIWYKKESRAATMMPRKPAVTRSLKDVVVREFGDTAVLTGILVSRNGAEEELSATTVVFVRRAGAWKICSAQWTGKVPEKPAAPKH